MTSFSAFWAGIALGFVSTPLYTWELQWRRELGLGWKEAWRRVRGKELVLRSPVCFQHSVVKSLLLLVVYEVFRP